MPIKVTCQCGQSFAAKDELAGKAVKCPKCQQPLRIPAARANPAAKTPAAKAPAAKPPAAKPKAPQPDPLGGGNMFDEVGLKQHAVGTRPCPGCGEPLKPEVVVCIKCGYNMKLGRRMTTAKAGGGGGDEHAAHGAVAADLLERTAQTLEEDKEAATATTSEGLPWWVYLILLLVLGGFLATMMVIAGRAKPKEKNKDSLIPSHGPMLASAPPAPRVSIPAL